MKEWRNAHLNGTREGHTKAMKLSVKKRTFFVLILTCLKKAIVPTIHKIR